MHPYLLALSLATGVVLAAGPLRAQESARLFDGVESARVNFIPVTQDVANCRIEETSVRFPVEDALEAGGLDFAEDAHIVVDLVVVSSFIAELETCSTYQSLRVTAPMDGELPFNTLPVRVTPILWYRSNMVFGGSPTAHAQAVASDLEAWAREFAGVLRQTNDSQ